MAKYRSWSKKHKCFTYFQNGFYGIDGAVFETNRFGFNWQNAEQFTGKTDKHGTEIYKNDIIKFCFAEKGDNSKNVVDGHLFYNTLLSTDVGEKSTKFLKVIGNIHENSELLEVK